MNVLGAVLAPRQVIVYTRAYGSMQARMCSPAIGETDRMVRTYPSPIMDSSTFPASGKLAVSEAKRNKNIWYIYISVYPACFGKSAIPEANPR
jgi:hypothetical protein